MQRSGAHNELGSRGESLAAEFLLKKGYEIVERNLFLKLGEIDLLCKYGEVLVIVEVKTQTTSAFADPIYQISPAKVRKLRSLGSIISTRYPDSFIRFDAVTIHLTSGEPTVTHLENLF